MKRAIIFLRFFQSMLKFATPSVSGKHMGKITMRREVIGNAYFILYSTKTIRLFALDFYEVIVDSVFGLINYHLIENLELISLIKAQTPD